MNILTFDIETIPDIKRASDLHDLHGLEPQDILAAVQTQRRQETGSDWFRPYLQQVVAISALLHTDNHCQVWSLGEVHADECEIISRFFEGIEKFSPTLVSWNGSQFDLPVLHYRALIHGINAKRYFETGASDPAFKFNNYLNRYHDRHIDLMDVLAAFSPRNYAPLDDIARLLGLPGKMDMSGAKVWEYYERGQMEAIRYYCETDVINTHLIFLKFQLLRGHFNADQLASEIERIKTLLKKDNKPHLLAYLARWEQHEKIS